MSEDRSLDEFAVDTDDDDVGNDDAVPPEDDDTDPANDDIAPANDDTDPANDDVTPATTTSAWRGDGGSCERCGDTASRLWGEDGTLVCPDCKVW